MPWTAAQFRERHAHHLTGKAAEEAAKMASAMVKEGTPEGEAIATAIKHGNAMMGKEKADKRYG